MKDFVFLSKMDFHLNLDTLTKGLDAKTNLEIDIIKKLMDEALKIADPKALFRRCSIGEKGEDFIFLDNIKFNSKILRSNLNKEKEAFIYIVTCGLELKKWSTSKEDEFENKVAEFINQSIIIDCHIVLKKYIEEQFNINSLARVNPGSTIDWDICEQKNIFAVLNNAENFLGVKLSDNFFMTPEKTYSGIYFHNEWGYKNCYMCPADTCPLREVPFDKDFYNTHYK